MIGPKSSYKLIEEIAEKCSKFVLQTDWDHLRLDIYYGLSGILLFLLDYAKKKDELNPSVQKALVKGLSELQGFLNRNTLNSSFFCGKIGTLYTILLLSNYLKRDVPQEFLFECCDSIEKDLKNDFSEIPDYLSGVSGTLEGLMMILDSFEFDIDATRRLNKLCELSVSVLINNMRFNLTGDLVYWCSRRYLSKLPQGVCGLSHGNTGISMSLILAGDYFGSLMLKRIGHIALACEDNLYEKELKNWPDLRSAQIVSAKDGNGTPFISQMEGVSFDRFAWCNGSPGIALCRNRVASILQGSGLSISDENILNAVQFLIQNLRPFLKSGANDFICHGKAGIGITFISFYDRFKKVEYDKANQMVVNSCLKSLSDQSFISTKSSLESLSLLNGIAGLGYYLLMEGPNTFRESIFGYQFKNKRKLLPSIFCWNLIEKFFPISSTFLKKSFKLNFYEIDQRYTYRLFIKCILKKSLESLNEHTKRKLKEALRIDIIILKVRSSMFNYHKFLQIEAQMQKCLPDLLTLTYRSFKDVELVVSSFIEFGVFADHERMMEDCLPINSKERLLITSDVYQNFQISHLSTLSFEIISFFKLANKVSECINKLVSNESLIDHIPSGRKSLVLLQIKELLKARILIYNENNYGKK